MATKNEQVLRNAGSMPWDSWVNDSCSHVLPTPLSLLAKWFFSCIATASWLQGELGVEKGFQLQFNRLCFLNGRFSICFPSNIRLPRYNSQLSWYNSRREFLKQQVELLWHDLSSESGSSPYSFSSWSEQLLSWVRFYTPSTRPLLLSLFPPVARKRLTTFNVLSEFTCYSNASTFPLCKPCLSLSLIC